MARILVTDGMASEGIAALTQAGHEVDNRKVEADELLQVIGEYDGLVIRSATTVTAEVLKAGAGRLKVVGRAGVGTDNVDSKAATEQGIIVMNAPLGNILSAAEHTIGMIFATARNIPQAHTKLVGGTWDKKSHIGSELHGKTLGIVGLGKIGKHVAHVLQAAGMNVIAFDPFLSDDVAEELSIKSVDLDTLLSTADFVTTHTPLTEKTANMINAERLKMMKSSARLVNVARGGIIDEAALAEALKNGEIAGAALDVFATEPLPADSPLIGCPRLITTPHLGASTEEAQVKVSTDIADQFNAYFDSGKIINSVNVQLRVDPAIDQYMHAAEVMAATLVQTVGEPIVAMEVRARGELSNYDVKPLTVAALKGALSQVSDQQVNFVNAGLIAQERGITITHSQTEQLREWLAHLVIKVTTKNRDHIIGGSIVNDQLRILRYDDYRLDLPVNNHLLIIEYPDRPGMVGTFGGILGENQVNIARMEVSRIDGRPDALVILSLDDPIKPEVIDQLKEQLQPKRLDYIEA